MNFDLQQSLILQTHMQYFSTPVRTPAIHRTTEVQTPVTYAIVHEDSVSLSGGDL